MLHFVQTPITKKRQFYLGLKAIYGLGQPTANKIVGTIGLLNDARGSDLRPHHRVRLKSVFHDFPRILGADLRNFVKTNVQRLINIRSYRGRRHKHAYPVRGQRSHTNAKTQKRLYRRWLINTYEKPKLVTSGKKKPNQVVKAKKAKGEKAKKKSVQKAQPKAPKYKI